MNCISKVAGAALALCLTAATAAAEGGSVFDKLGAGDIAASMVIANEGCGTKFPPATIGKFIVLYAEAHGISLNLAASAIADRSIAMQKRIADGYLAHQFCHVMMIEQARLGW